MHLSELITLSESALRRARKYRHIGLCLPIYRVRWVNIMLGSLGQEGQENYFITAVSIEMEDCFYLSLDMLDREADLFGLIEKLVGEYKFTNFFLDEIHFHKTQRDF